MLFTYIKGVMGHVMWQWLKGWLILLAMAGLFIYIPEITAWVAGVLKGWGYAPDGFEAKAFDNQRKVLFWSALLSWLSIEFQGWTLLKRQAHRFEEPEVQQMVAALAKKARLWRMPTVITLPEGMVNAAATESLIWGNKVVVMGEIAQVLKKDELEVVLAHETAHLKHLDIWALLVAHVGSRVLSWQKWAVASAAIYSAIQYMNGKGTWGELAFLLTAFGLLFGLHVVYQLLELAHSRCREYLADAGGIALTSWQHAPALLTGLLRVGHHMTGWHPFKLLRRESALLQAHPAMIDRGEALGVQVQVARNGDVNVAGTIVEA
ncbi:MAG: hypothetical protein RIQ56_300 [Candidatus Parcubacteria bacterium]